MKKLILIFALAAVFIFDIQAQAFQKGDNFLSLGVGGSNFWYFVENSSRYYRGTYYTPVTFQFNVQGEFSVHEYVGIGFTIGIGGRGSDYWYRNAGVFNMPIGVIGNFHFYQFIADKVGKNIHSDKLDVYVGLNVGSGFAVFTTSPSTTAAIAFVGPQVGARYFFTPKIAANLEMGYGKSWINGGVSFKLGK